MKVSELLAEESSFCRGNFAASKEEKVNFVNPRFFNGTCKAVKWDIMGAIAHCYENEEECQKHVDAIRISPKIRSWVAWYKNSINHEQLTSLNKTYGADWPIFNDFAPFIQVKNLIKEMNL